MRLGVCAVLGTLTALGLTIGGIAYAAWTEKPPVEGDFGDPFVRSRPISKGLCGNSGSRTGPRSFVGQEDSGLTNE